MSTLITSNISDGTTSVGTGYVVNGSAKAWVNFNGTGTIATRDSFNVASLTDYGVGNYAVSLTNSMSDANYSGFGSGQFFGVFNTAGTNTASSVEARTYTAAGALVDSDPVTAAIYGDLA